MVTFVLVTLSIMAASIYLIYRLTNFFGFKLKYKSLLLCGVMAIVVNVTAAVMSPYLTQAHYWRLVVLVLVASALVTVYNERLLMHELQPTGSVSVPVDVKEVRVPPVAEAVTATEDKIKPEKQVAAPVKKPGALAVKPPLRSSAPDDLSKLNTLDLLLDYAYEQKKLGEPDKAIAAYQTALNRYRDDDYVPFIVIDLGNTYKETAAYDEAIKIYQEALNIPVIAAGADTRREFYNNLAYLRIVKEVLIKHKALNTPFPQIPAKYMAEIEKTFQDRRGRTT